MEQWKIELAKNINSQQGHAVNSGCEICNNRGYHIKLEEEKGVTYDVVVICECAKAAASVEPSPPKPKPKRRPEKAKQPLPPPVQPEQSDESEIDEYFRELYRDITAPKNAD